MVVRAVPATRVPSVERTFEREYSLGPRLTRLCEHALDTLAG